MTISPQIIISVGWRLAHCDQPCQHDPFPLVDAPDQLIAISNEFRSLSNVLIDIHIVLPQRDIPDLQEARLGERIQITLEILKELEVYVGEYQELDPSTKRFGGRSRWVWTRVRLYHKTIDLFRSRIRSTVLRLRPFLVQMTRLVPYIPLYGFAM